MNRALAEAIVGSLSVGRVAPEQMPSFGRFSIHAWERTLPWLDNEGLSLYFLDAVGRQGLSGSLPGQVLSQLIDKFHDNEKRTAHLLQQFRRINEQFDSKGINYAVMKGFSLVPEFCPNPCLRGQSDLDYLVKEEQLTLVTNGLLELGYRVRSKSNWEIVFDKPDQSMKHRKGGQYSITAPYTVELHFSIWNSKENYIPEPDPFLAPDRLIRKAWAGLDFPVLPPESVFLMQVLHLMNHLLGGWVKLSWLLELTHFIQREEGNECLWAGLEQRGEASKLLRDFVAITIELAARVFDAPIPSGIQDWINNLPEVTRIWLGVYGRDYSFESQPLEFELLFSRTKLNWFLHKQYVSDASARRERMRRLFLPLKAPPQISILIEKNAESRWKARQRQVMWFCRRVLFHGSAGLRYLFELPRWWLCRTTTSRIYPAHRAKPMERWTGGA